MAANEGVFTTPYGDVQFAFSEYDVRLLAPALTCKRITMHVEFWMRKDSNREWVRAGQYGSVIKNAETGDNLDPTPAFTPPNGVTTKELRDRVLAVRDGWRAYAEANPELDKDIVRTEVAKRIRRLTREREYVEELLNRKSAEIQKLLRVQESGDWADYREDGAS